MLKDLRNSNMNPQNNDAFFASINNIDHLINSFDEDFLELDNDDDTQDAYSGSN